MFNAKLWDGMARDAMFKILNEDKAMVEELMPEQVASCPILCTPVLPLSQIYVFCAKQLVADAFSMSKPRLAEYLCLCAHSND